MSEGVQEFTWDQLRSENDQLGKDGKEGKTYLAEVSSTYTGSVCGKVVTVKRKTNVAVKTFKSTKSKNKIMSEATMQQKCAILDASPNVLGVNLKEKYIVMQALDSLPVETYRDGDMPDELQYMLCALMARMDESGIMHGDMNALNVMLNQEGRPYMIDFGFAKKIDKKCLKKRGPHPNISVTLWGLVRGFRRRHVGVDIMNACVKAKDPTSFIKRGESYLKKFDRKRRKRR